MAIETTIELSSDGDITPKATHLLVARQLRTLLTSKFPEADGFTLTETQTESEKKVALGSVSYFKPMSAIKYKMHESDKDGFVKFEITYGKTTGSEVTITLDESSTPKLIVKVDWTSRLYQQLTNLAIGLAVIVTAIVGISACVEKFQQGSWPELLLFVVLPWKLIWTAFLALLITSVPAMIIAWIAAKIVFLFGPKRFNSDELSKLSGEIAGMVKMMA